MTHHITSTTNGNKGLYTFMAVLLGIILLINLLLSIIMPAFTILEIIAGIGEYFTIKKIKNINKENVEMLDKENIILKMGYRKIYDNLFIDEKGKKLNIQGKEYNFSQIIDCELIEKDSTINNTYGITKGKIKNNGKLKTNTNSFSIETNFCTDLHINIVVDDFNSPNIKLDIKGKALITVGSKKYNDMLAIANQVIATLKLIISKGNCIEN